jgi:hypothetical protein
MRYGYERALLIQESYFYFANYFTLAFSLTPKVQLGEIVILYAQFVGQKKTLLSIFSSTAPACMINGGKFINYLQAQSWHLG